MKLINTYKIEFNIQYNLINIFSYCAYGFNVRVSLLCSQRENIFTTFLIGTPCALRLPKLTACALSLHTISTIIFLYSGIFIYFAYSDALLLVLSIIINSQFCLDALIANS